MPTDDLTDDFLETSFAATLRQMANNAPAIGVEGMASDAARRGRRRTRRRKAAIGAAALTVLLAGGSAAAAWPSPTDTVGAASGSPTQPGTGRPASAAPTTPAAPAAPVSATQLLEHLESLLPAWTLTDPAAHGTEPTSDSRATYASYGIDDGHGKAWVRVSLRHHTLPVKPEALAACPDSVAEPFAVCSHTVLPDGSTLVVLQNYQFPDRKDGAKWWSAELDRPDGTSVKVNESNSATLDSQQPTRTDPPLTPAQLRAIATDPGWLPALAAITPVPAVPPADIARQNYTWPSTAKILATAAPLLPTPLAEADTGGGDDSGAHFTVDDGHGKSLVDITVQDWSVYKVGTSTYDDVTGTFRDAQVLPDGTRVLRSAEHDYAGQKGLVRNSVDILRPNHLRVTAWALNSTSPTQAPTRTAPALSLDQLQTLVTDPTWAATEQ